MPGKKTVLGDRVGIHDLGQFNDDTALEAVQWMHAQDLLRLGSETEIDVKPRQFE